MRHLVIVCGCLLFMVPTRAPAQDAKANAPKKQLPPGTLDRATLKEWLADLGYKPEDWNESYFKITIVRDNRNIFFLIGPSSDMGRLWYLAPLSSIPDLSRVPAEPIRKLLEENDAIQPNCFTYLPESKTLYLASSVRNSELTRAKLRKGIQDFDALVRKKEPLWKPALFRSDVVFPEMTADAKATLKRLQGK